jgi:poly(A) polymerase
MTNKQAAIKIVRRLRSYGFEALLAGGCVRDMLLGRPASDYDVATSALPEDVIRLFKRTLKVGAKFGVVIVLVKDIQVEVATFRTESGYADGRHPALVKFAGAFEDAGRRDFTINGMFYDPVNDRIVDYVDGQADLKKHIVRTIGRPEERFSEDYLRMLRAIRFSTQLSFKIEPKTFSAICTSGENITKISGERIAVELEGILIDPNRSTGASLLVESGLANAIFPGFMDKQAKFAVSVLGQLRKKVNFALALGGFFAGCNTEFAMQSCKILKLSRNRTKHLKFLLSGRDKLLNDSISLAELKKFLAEPYFWDLYELQRAIQRAKKSSITALVNIRRRIKTLGADEIKPKPLLTGHDLIRLGAVPGPVLGQLAEEIYIAQLEGQLQTAQQAEAWAIKWLQKHKAFTNGHGLIH